VGAPPGARTCFASAAALPAFTRNLNFGIGTPLLSKMRYTASPTSSCAPALCPRIPTEMTSVPQRLPNLQGHFTQAVTPGLGQA
jgi:hypothetical protein